MPNDKLSDPDELFEEDLDKHADVDKAIRDLYVAQQAGDLEGIKAAGDVILNSDLVRDTQKESIRSEVEKAERALANKADAKGQQFY